MSNIHPILLEVNDLSLSFNNKNTRFKALHSISFKLYEGETIGIVGESGSGKSITSLSIMQLLDSPPAEYTSGEILLHKNGEVKDLINLKENQLCKIRGNDISMIFQEPMTSLNPSQKCGKQVKEAIEIHREIDGKSIKREVIKIFEDVLLPDPERVYNSFPHQLSGGQLQRVMIAMAMINRPSILIADEPTTALDVTVQKQILTLIGNLKKDFNTTTIFISHDLGVVNQIADRVIVMQSGKIVETGRTEEIFTAPKHPYTKGLIACRPPLKKRVNILPTVQDFLSSDEKGINAFLKGIEQTAESYTAHIKNITENPVLLRVESLSKTYVAKKNWIGKPILFTKALQNINLEVRKGETLGLVGESGCGKSTLGNCILRLINPDRGKIIYDGIDITSLSKSQLKPFRKKLQIIFQDPYSSLNPRMKIGAAILEPMKVHNLFGNDKTRKEKVVELLETVGLKPDYFNRFPHQFSGGQRQRICIARTLSLQPEFIVCDESVSALDVSVQAQVLNLLNELKNKFGLSLIFISHDLSVIKHISDHIAVLNQGKIVEYGDAESVFHHPQNQYSKELIAAIPK